MLSRVHFKCVDSGRRNKFISFQICVVYSYKMDKNAQCIVDRKVNFLSRSFRGCCDVDVAESMVSANISHEPAKTINV